MLGRERRELEVVGREQGIAAHRFGEMTGDRVGELVVVVLEGLQGLYQFQHNWINYRGTSEQLKREKYLWLAKAGPYASADHPDVLLAERIEALISREQTRWVALKEQPSAGTQDQSPPVMQNQTSAAWGAASNGHPMMPESWACESFGTFVGI